MSEPIVSKNKVVSLTYTLRDQGGNVVEMSDLPVSYVHGGKSDLFEKIEAALEGRTVGEHVGVDLSPEEGFGYPNPELTFTDDVENVPPELRRVGVQLEAQNEKGEVLQFTVTRVEGGKLIVDANHPLAGQTVHFDVKVQAIRDATPDELRHGVSKDPLHPA